MISSRTPLATSQDGTRRIYGVQQDKPYQQIVLQQYQGGYKLFYDYYPDSERHPLTVHRTSVAAFAAALAQMSRPGALLRAGQLSIHHIPRGRTGWGGQTVCGQLQQLASGSNGLQILYHPQQRRSSVRTHQPRVLMTVAPVWYTLAQDIQSCAAGAAWDDLPQTTALGASNSAAPGQMQPANMALSLPQQLFHPRQP